MSVTELVRIEEKANGSRSWLGLILARSAKPITIGTKNAVDAVLLMKAPSPAEAIITTISSRKGDVPVSLRIAPPAMSITPVRINAAVRSRRPRIIMTVSLPNPAKAASGVRMPVKIRTRTRLSAVTSAGMASMANKTTLANTNNSTIAICKVMGRN